MTFFDKVGSKAKEIADSARINVRIVDEKRNIAELKVKLGQLVWDKYCANCITDADITAMCEAIRTAYDSIDNYNAELDKLRDKPLEQDETADSTVIKCINCGADIFAGQNYCSNCGIKIPEREEPRVRKCVNCGRELEEVQFFCPDCGAKN